MSQALEVMVRKATFIESAPRPNVPISPAVWADGALFLSGQVPIDPATGTVAGDGIGSQTDQVFRNIQAILEAASLTLEDVVKVTAFLTDIADFPEFNKAYQKVFSEPFPARSTIGGIQLAGPFRVEIEAVALAASAWTTLKAAHSPAGTATSLSPSLPRPSARKYSEVP
jgi:2-iminobutanoate/2-iminopropanoate deaminase